MGLVIPEIPPTGRGVVRLDPTGGAASGGQGDELGEDQVSRDTPGRNSYVFKQAPANGCSVGLQSAGVDISRRDRLQGQARGWSGSAAVIVSPAVGCATGLHPAGVQGSNADGGELRVHARLGAHGRWRRWGWGTDYRRGFGCRRGRARGGRGRCGGCTGSWTLHSGRRRLTCWVGIGGGGRCCRFRHGC